MLTRVRMAIGRWLIPGIVQDAEAAEEWRSFSVSLESELITAQGEKNVLLAQVAALKKSADEATVRNDVTAKLAERLYDDLLAAKAEFIAYLTKKDLPPAFEEVDVPSGMLHPDDIMARIAAIQAEAERMFDGGE